MPNNFAVTEQYRTKFFLKENVSKNFLELSEEQLSMLSKHVYEMQEEMGNTLSHGLRRYQNTLQYLTRPFIHLKLLTFDERIAFLIMMTDPDLVIFKDFLKLDLISLTEIASVEDTKEREELKKLRTQTILEYENIVRKKIGFFDSKLLKYEELFFKKFFNEKELITEVRRNSQNNFMNKSKLLKNFDSISDKRYAELVDIAQIWLSFAPEKYNYRIAAYSVANQRKLLGLNTFPEQLALFILLVDSNLDMLKIYEEECNMKIIEERIIEQFGDFDRELLVLERKFYDRFCSEKELSVWSKEKKR